MDLRILRTPSWLSLGLLLLLFFPAGQARAAGCHTVCNLTLPPDCVGCGFTAFSNVFCQRAGCDRCFEDSCSVALPFQGDQLAQAASGQNVCPTKAVTPVQPLKVVRIQVLA